MIVVKNIAYKRQTTTSEKDRNSWNSILNSGVLTLMSEVFGDQIR